VESIPARAAGTVDPAQVNEHLSEDVAATMLTNPITGGLFERDVVAIAEAVHAAGAYFYADGANFNAIVGKVRPGDLGVDAMHLNLHKTFSTPHGGGGPGAGPVALSAALAPFMPVPYTVVDADGVRYVERAGASPADAWTPTPDPSPHHAEGVSSTRRGGEPVGAKPLGRMCAFHGQMGMFVRALAYMLSHGSDGMRQASEDAVLNANYVRASLADLMSLPFGNRPCMHEALFDDAWLDGTGITTLDFAKAMIDEGYHPMTVYFPLVVHGSMLIEPTESESKASLDLARDELLQKFRRAPVGCDHVGADLLEPRRHGGRGHRRDGRVVELVHDRGLCALGQEERQPIVGGEIVEALLMRGGESRKRRRAALRQHRYRLGGPA